jgi:putative drug exporter of the RND superfamily
MSRLLEALGAEDRRRARRALAGCPVVDVPPPRVGQGDILRVDLVADRLVLGIRLGQRGPGAGPVLALGAARRVRSSAAALGPAQEPQPRRLGEDVVPEELDGTDTTAAVGGITAALEDQSDYVTDRMPLFIAGVVGLSFLLLLVAFHSPRISLKASIMNLLSVGAAYGVMTLVAKGGAVGKLIGIDHEVAELAVGVHSPHSYAAPAAVKSTLRSL